MLRKAASMAVCKINIDSDLRVACTAAIRKHMFEHPDHFDPRQYLGDARAAVKEIVRHKDRRRARQQRQGITRRFPKQGKAPPAAAGGAFFAVYPVSVCFTSR